MKKLFFALALLAALFLASHALAAELPPPIAAVFETEAWTGWEPVRMDDYLEQGFEGNLHAAIIMQKGERNVLCMLHKYGDFWRITAQSALAIYQGDVLPTMSFAESDILITKLTITYAEGREGAHELYHWALINGNPDAYWQLERIGLTEPGRNGIKLITGLQFYLPYVIVSEGDDQHVVTIPSGSSERVFGKLNRYLSNFDINGYPRSIALARNILGGLPTLAEGEQQDPLPTPIPATVHPGEWPVYLGPGAPYEQINGAIVTQDTHVQAIAAEGAYVLVAFVDAEGLTRYGHIALNAIEPIEGLPEAQYATLHATHISDQPTQLKGKSSTGDEVFVQEGFFIDPLYLATLGTDWSYVDYGFWRMFVRSKDLSVMYDLDVSEAPIADPQARITRDVDIIDDPYRRSEILKLGEFKAGDLVVFLSTLYGEWAYVQFPGDDGTQRGFIPRDAIEALDEYALEGNG